MTAEVARENVGTRIRVLVAGAVQRARSNWAILSIFAAGLGIRLLLAPHGGFPGDLRFDGGLADQVSTQDWSLFVAPPPPDFVHWPYLYVLYLVGSFSHFFFAASPSRFLLKLPGIIGDLGLALSVMRLVVKAAPGPPEAVRKLRTLAAAAILLNPAIIFVSAVWGQSDSLTAFVTLESFLLLFTGRSLWWRDAAGFFLLSLAVANKPQLLVILPLVGLLAWRRAAGGSFRERRRLLFAALRVAGLALLGALVVMVLIAPFGLGVDGAIQYYLNLPTYEVTSAWAFNLWGAIGFWQYDHGPAALTVAGVPALYVGSALFIAAMAVLCIPFVRALRRGDTDIRLALIGCGTVICADFALLTRQHERYLYLALPCFAALLANRRMRVVLGILTGLFLLNLYFPYAYFVAQFGEYTPHFGPVFDLVYGTTQDSVGKKLISAVTATSCLAIAWQSWRWLRPRSPSRKVSRLVSRSSGAAAVVSPATSARARGTAPAERIMMPVRIFAGRALATLTASHAVRALANLTASRAVRALAKLIASRAVQALARLTASSDKGRLSTAPLWWRRAPWLLVAGACIFGLVMLTGELTTAAYPNDESYHFEMVRWAAQQINEGHVPLDGWFPFLNLGVAQFHHYQSLAHLITAYISLIFGTDPTERWAAYLLLALFPLSVYAGSRLLGWSPWVAGSAALASPLLVSVTGYGYESNSYTWLGNGIWSQEWGMLLLPLAWGLSWRAINGTGRARYALAALAVGLTIAMHFLTGYLALLSIGVFVVVIWRGLLRRIGRGVLVFVGAALVVSWVVVPLLADANVSANSEFLQNTFWADSYGAPQVLGWLFTGQIFDSGRFPIVSLLVALGTVVCLVRCRRDARARALLGLMTLSLVLWSGRPTFGLILNLLPGNSDLQLQRYIMGVHLAGDLLAGLGLAWAGGLVFRLLRSWRPRLRLLPITAGLMGAAVLITLPAWLDRAAYAQSDATYVASQINSDQSDGASLNVLINDIKARGGGRTYAGLPANWGHEYQVGSVPVYAYLTDHDVDELGFTLRTAALAVDNEAYFNEDDPAQYQLYDVRYVLMPSGMQPPVPATLLAGSGRHRLWEVATTGYLQVVDTAGVIAADRFDMARQMQPFLHSAAFHQGQLATVAFNGAAAATSTLPGLSSPATPPGTSGDVDIQSQDGFFAGKVRANRTAAVVLKATYDPRWRVTVDGTNATPYMVVPGFVAVTVGPGQHSVVFQYLPYPHYALLLAIGALTLLALALGPWLWRRWDVHFIGRRGVLFPREAMASRRWTSWLASKPTLEAPSGRAPPRQRAPRDGPAEDDGHQPAGHLALAFPIWLRAARWSPTMVRLRLTPIRLAAAVTFSICLAVFVLTLLPGVSFGDTAELQRIPHVLGIPHSTGYPVQVLVGWLFSLPPIGSVAWRANLLSAAAVSGAAATFVLAMGRLCIRPLFAASAAVTAAFSVLVWSEATVAGVNTVELLAVTLVLHRALVWRDERRPRDLYLAALLLGIAALTHFTAVALAGLTAVFVVWVGRRELLAHPAWLAKAAGTGLVGLSFILYLPIRGSLGPSASYLALGTPAGLLAWVLPSGSGSPSLLSPAAGLTNLAAALPDLVSLFVMSSGPLFVLLAGLGIIVGCRRDGATALLSVMLVVTSAYAYVNYGIFVGDFVPTHTRYLLLAVFVAAAWVAAGLQWLERWLGRVRQVTVLVALVLPILAVTSNWSAMNRSNNRAGEDFANSMFARLPSHAVILSYWDANQTMAYVHCVEGVRPDVMILSPLDPNFQACDPPGTLTALVDRGDVYALFYQPADVAWLGQDFDLTQVAMVQVPYGGSRADYTRPLYRLSPKGIAP